MQAVQPSSSAGDRLLSYRVVSEGRDFAVERVPGRYKVLGPVDVDTAREFCREMNCAPRVAIQDSSNKGAQPAHRYLLEQIVDCQSRGVPGPRGVL